MKKGQKTTFSNKNTLEEMVQLRRHGVAISSLAIIYGVDNSTIRWHLRRYYITNPNEVYSIERIVAKLLPSNSQPQWKVINGERINLGKSYKEYLGLSPYKIRGKTLNI